MLMPTKEMAFCSPAWHGELQLNTARVQFFKKSVGFVDVRHNG